MQVFYVWWGYLEKQSYDLKICFKILGIIYPTSMDYNKL